MPLNNNTDVNGNKDVKKLMEQFTHLVHEQPVGYVAVIGAEEPNRFMLGYSGTVELENVALQGLREAIKQIESNVENRTMPDPDPSLDESYAAYNITMSPLSYDFCTWMISQDMKRKKAGVAGPMKIGFWMGRDGKTGLSGMPDRVNMLNKVCRPALELMGGIEDPMACKARFDNFFSYKYIVELAKEGVPITKLRTSTKLDLEPGYVTMTLRETSYWPHRNSKLDEWIRFAKYLKNKGYRVIFVRDTAKADEPIEGFDTYPAASRDLDVRCALYQGALCNLFVANGPVTLGYFGDQPWLKFMEIDDNGAYNAARTQYWIECVGLNPKQNEQFPWSTPQQKIVWKPDYYTNMVTAWEELAL